MSKFNIRIAINGDEEDGDGNPWCESVGQIKTVEGGGGFSREANQAVCTFVVAMPLDQATDVRTITIGVQGPYGTSTTTAAWYQDAPLTSPTERYRIVFHGYVTSSKATGVGKGQVIFTAISEMQGLFERRAHLAASTNTHPRAIASAIETAHSITVDNGGMLPGSGDFQNIDQPKQGSAANGEWLRNAMAGTGMTVVGEWLPDPDMTSPQMAWRTDYPWKTGGNFDVIPAGRPWEYEYTDVGIEWADFVAKVEVNGEQGNTLDHVGYVRYPSFRHMGPRPATRVIDVSNGTRYYGNAQLDNATVRRRLGYQMLSINSWIDTAAECEDAAGYLLRRIGDPKYMKMYRIGYWPELLLKSMNADANYDGTSYDKADVALKHAAVCLGDSFTSRQYGNDGYFDNQDGLSGINIYGTWPTTCPVGSVEYYEMEALWAAAPSNDGVFSGLGPTYTHTVRTVWREWTPAGGWHIEVALEPDDQCPVTDRAHGTY